MVIDDEGRQLRLLDAMLGPLNCNVVLVSGGLDALDKLKTMIPDVILLDVLMPGTDGYKVCKSIKSNVKTAIIPVIMITSLNAGEERIKGIQSGANDFLTKPFDKMDLLFRIRNALYTKGLIDIAQNKYEQLKVAETERSYLVEHVAESFKSVLENLQLFQKEINKEISRKHADILSTTVDSFSSAMESILPLIKENQ